MLLYRTSAEGTELLASRKGDHGEIPNPFFYTAINIWIKLLMPVVQKKINPPNFCRSSPNCYLHWLIYRLFYTFLALLSWGKPVNVIWIGEFTLADFVAIMYFFQLSKKIVFAQTINVKICSQNMPALAGRCWTRISTKAMTIRLFDLRFTV